MVEHSTETTTQADAPDRAAPMDGEPSHPDPPSAQVRHTTDDARYTALIERYARYAPVYDRQFARYSRATLSAAHDAILESGAKTLIDVACGTGLLAERLVEQRPDLHVTGVDISADMLTIAKHRLDGPQFDWKVGKAEALPVESGRFDVLTCNSAFHLVREPEQALAEFRRVLRSGGVLIIVDWCREYLAMWAMELFYRYFGRHQRSIRTLNELTSLVEAGGFTIEQRRRFRVGVYWGMMCIVARKRAS